MILCRTTVVGVKGTAREGIRFHLKYSTGSWGSTASEQEEWGTRSDIKGAGGAVLTKLT